MFATTLACLRRDVPPIHYMMAVSGGRSIRCAPYTLFGTQACADAAVQALVGRKPCLLATHGMTALGADRTAALAMPVTVEGWVEQTGGAWQGRGGGWCEEGVCGCG